MEKYTLIYLAKVSLSILCFYGFYILFLKKETFFSEKRYYLLFAMLFSMIYPALEIEIIRNTPLPITEYIINITEVQDSIATSSGKNIATYLLYLIPAIDLLLLLKFIYQLIHIVRLRYSGSIINHEGLKFIELPQPSPSAFSFLKWIFIPAEQSNQHTLQIITHEQVHAKQLHSLDILLAELITIFLWWNPLIWLLKKEIRLNHEYIADHVVLRQGINKREYQHALFHTAIQHSEINIISNFNVSQLKKRIMMMNKRPTSTWQYLKFATVLPIICALFLTNITYASPDIITVTLSDISNTPDKNEVAVVSTADEPTPQKAYHIEVKQPENTIAKKNISKTIPMETVATINKLGKLKGRVERIEAIPNNEKEIWQNVDIVVKKESQTVNNINTPFSPNNSKENISYYINGKIAYDIKHINISEIQSLSVIKDPKIIRKEFPLATGTAIIHIITKS